MAEVPNRVARLSPDRQRLLERLVGAGAAARPAARPTTPVQPLPEATDVILRRAGSGEDTKAVCREFYDVVSRGLDASIFGEFSLFLNYGYVANLNPQFAAVELPAAALNKNSVKLVLEVVEDVVTPGARVLDVGCGRGGTASVILQFFQPGSVAGLDLSAVAVAFCRRTHRDPRVAFLQGDSEHLPFSAASFDVVTNIESSSCYPNVGSFYSEAARVLVPGGYFLYSDCLPVEQLRDGIQYLRSMGFTVERDRDITSNVLASCDEIAGARVGAYGANAGGGVLDNFLGTPGSQYYEEMRSRRWAYKIFKLKKTRESHGN